MRTFFAVIGVLAIFVVGVFAVLVVIGLNTVKPLIAEATVYADDAIPGIATEWDGDELRRRASEELRAEISDDQLDGIMAFGAKNLGAMTDYDGATCNVLNIEFTTESGEVAQASCQARAEHELGGAGYTLNLLKRNDTWSVLGFFVTPDQILETDDNARTVYNNNDQLDVMTISISDRSFGLTTGQALDVGAGVTDFQKIENLP